MTTPVPLASMDWPWKAENHGGAIILVSDEQFVNLAARPDEAVEKPAPWLDEPQSLRDFCRRLAEGGARKIHIAYDYFFGGNGRGLYPDTPEFIESLKKIHDVAREYGVGIEPSVLSPLELGVGYRRKTGECGRWMQYGEGLRDPQTGHYLVQVWQNTQWVNNKGPMPVKLVDVRAFAFREKPVDGTIYFSVLPEDIRELPAPTLTEYPGSQPAVYGLPEIVDRPNRSFQAIFSDVKGDGLLPGETPGDGFDRVLVVLVYETVEMDYFTPAARQFVLDLVEQYHASGIELTGLYSDEMHIQQDWVYHTHHDRGQFTLRYVSPGFEKAFAERFGARYADFAPWLVYFTTCQHQFLASHEPKLPNQHVFGDSVEDIQATLRLRSDYYHFLTRGVVDLMNEGREKLEQLQGAPLDAFYHSTWAESPTCDAWAVNGTQQHWAAAEHRRRYEYTPDFIWSNTIQQAAAACADYFTWNEFLTGGNNDVPEGGYADRNYYGRALACSLAALNRNPLASCGMWGMPPDSAERMAAVSAAYGAGGKAIFRAVQEYAPRSSEVLFLYPLDLCAVDERFGSWMVQYGYANYISAEALTRFGRVEGGALVVKGSRYRAVCALYEPLPQPGLLKLLADFVHAGGSLVWTSIPPLVKEGAAWMEDLFAARVCQPGPSGQGLPGRTVNFHGALQSVQAMGVLTDFSVDFVYGLDICAGGEMVASLLPGGSLPRLQVGVRKTHPAGGQAIYLGFRPRDDQAASLGQEVRTWFEILSALGVYPGEGNPNVVSRTTQYVTCAFPNGAVALAPHYREHSETWSGRFFRDGEKDRLALADNPVPGDLIDARSLAVAGQRVTFQGRHCVSWRLTPEGELAAFAGVDCRGIEIDGRSWQWSDTPVEVAWHPLGAVYAVRNGDTPLYRLWGETPGKVRFPLALVKGSEQRLELWLGGAGVGEGIEQISFMAREGILEIEFTPAITGRWLYLVEKKG